MSSNVRYGLTWNHDNMDAAAGFVIAINANYSAFTSFEVGNDGTGSHNCQIVVPQGQYIEVQVMTKGSDGVTLSAPVTDSFYSDVEPVGPVAPNAPYNLGRVFIQFE